MEAAPNIFRFDDYRVFLADCTVHSKKTRNYSMRKFAQQAGFGAPNILRLIIDGKRNLSEKSIAKFSSTLKLSEDESLFFQDLVLMNQAESPSERLRHYQRLVRHPRRRKAVPLEQAQLGFFRHWLSPVIYEMVQLPTLKPDAEWISAQFEPPPPVAEVKRAMHDLLAVGLVTEQQGGSWSQSAADVVSPQNAWDLHLYAYHEQALGKAADALDSLSASQRDFHVLTIAAPAAAIPKLKDWWQACEAELLTLIEAMPGEKDEVLQISWQMFPILSQLGKPAKKP